MNSDAGTITIEGNAHVTATGGLYSAGIGGGSGGDGGTIKISGDLNNEGYEFDGWNTADDGSGTPYVPGDALTITADTTLYAQWATQHTVSYDANDAGGTAPTSVIGLRAGDKIVIKNSGGLSYSGHAFDGWNTKADGSGTPYAPGDEIMAAYSMTLYAQWTVPVTSVRLGSTSKTMAVGDTATLTTTVSPSGADNADVTWTSTDTSVATVSQSGKVTAVSDGAASIIADADGVYAVCTILVSNEDNDDDDVDDGDSDDDNTQPSPTRTPSTTPEPTEKTDDVPDTGDDSPEPTPSTVIVTIVVSDLPEGTAAVRLPNGDVVELDGSDTLRIEVGAEYIGDDGSVVLTALDDEGMPLGEYTAGVQVITVFDSGSAWDKMGPILMCILIGIGGLGAAGIAAYLILRRKQAA